MGGGRMIRTLTKNPARTDQSPLGTGGYQQ
ncbi:MAG: hypothetical protein RLZZ347_48 [Candidatus Parcubacteria bacterium]|jgi:hypothetical protein